MNNVGEKKHIEDGRTSFENIIKEVEDIFRNFQPIFIFLKGTEHEAFFKQNLVSDFARIALICGEADKTFDPMESIATIFVLGTLWNGQEFFSNVVLKWNELSKADKEKYEDDLSKLFEGIREQNDKHLSTLSFVKEWDKYNGTSFFEIVSSTMERFAKLVVEADETVGSEEQEILKYIKLFIYDPKKAKLPNIRATGDMANGILFGQFPCNQQTVVPLSFKEISHELILIYEGIHPLIQVFKERGLDDTLGYVMACFSKIALLLNESGSALSAQEYFVTFFITTSISRGKQFLLYDVPNWELHKILFKDALETFQNYLDALVKVEFKIDLSMWHELDNKLGTSYLDAMSISLYRFAQLIVKADGTVTPEEERVLKHVWKLLHKKRKVKKSLPASDSDRNVGQTIASATQSTKETLDEVFKHLNELIGMENIKSEVNTLTNFLKIQKERTDRGLSKTPLSLHSVFCGPPGTGKTTVARLLGKIYKQMGFLSKGHLVETDRSGLVAGYVGQTALKVDEIVNKALDGVLFIDEAYALKPENASSDFGQEAIDILLKRMEDNRDRLVVICAGYTDETMRFLEANPGVKSRFNRYFYFEDYKPDELLAIFETFCKECHFVLTDEAKNKLLDSFNNLYANKDKTFGNGRLARNIFEKAIERQANRIAGIVPLTEELLITLTEEDVPPENLFSA